MGGGRRPRIANGGSPHVLKAYLTRFTPYDDARGWLRGLGVAVAVGAFLAFSGAFGTDDAPAGRRWAYWLGLMVLGYFLGAFIARLFFLEGGRARAPLWLRAVGASLVMAAPFTGVVWISTRWALGSDIPVRALPFLFTAVFSVALVITVLNMLLETRAAGVTHAQATPPKFLERLPLKLRGAEVWAVEAEDHYLRLHTSKGQDLILMRLSDAVAELEGLEGARVHRSWWVARDAVVEAQRGDGRALLTLKDGSKVPVSRTYARLLREAGWF